MKYIELQESFELEINVLDDVFNKPNTSDIEWWLNRGLEKFYKTRYSGNNYLTSGFEQNQKRIDDLRTLVTSKTYTTDITVVSNSEYKVTLPNNYVILLGDTVGIQPNSGYTSCWELDDNSEYIPYSTDTIESTIETIDRLKQDSLSEFRLKYCKARPLKLVKDNEIILYTDGKYKVSTYTITYLRKPTTINIHSNPYVEYTDMPEHTHSEIVKIAAQMYIENKSNSRINTHTSEVNQME